MESKRWEKKLNEMMEKHRKTQEENRSKKRSQIYKQMREVTAVPKIDEMSDKVAMIIKMKENGILEQEDQQQQQEEHKSQVYKATLQAKKQDTSPNLRSSQRDATTVSQKSKSKLAEASKSRKKNEKPKLKSLDLSNMKLEEFKELKKSFLRAQCLHTRQNSAQAFSPRLHIDLTTGEASELYINARAPQTARVKTPSGFSSAETMQRGLLQSTENQQSNSKETFYEKNMKWATEKERGLKTARENRKSCDLSECTFKPSIERLKLKEKPTNCSKEEKTYSGLYSDRKVRDSSKTKPEGEKRTNEIESSQFLATIDASAIKLASESLLKKSLAPSNIKVKRKEGFDLKLFMKNAKPMVKYSSLNYLN
ncbi:unnamed protein product [Blepharisma stoltei]|uniref:Uncharacterized protein n=1 Tax=Blepharisma stoltei TaxID=1481888 RepID=A0AAU9J2Y8_9CILI|nr:unnamed protein product [Blepharisma stoltei]